MSKPSFREYAEIPTYTSARFTSDPEDGAFSAIQITTSVADHTRNIRRTVIRSLLVTPNSIASTPGVDAANAQASVVSPSGTLQATLREITNDQGSDKKRYVEIWRGDKLVAQKDVTKVHGEFCKDDIFKSLSFSPSETAFVYTAEANNEDKDNAKDYEKFIFTPHFGEKMTSRKKPTLFIMRWSKSSEMTEDFSPYVIALVPASLEPLKVDVAFGQAVFSSEEVLYATGYEQTIDGRKLGITGCSNRPTGIWTLTIPSIQNTELSKVECQFSKLTSSDHSSFSPRVINHDGEITVIWLSTDRGGAHISCSRLHSWKNISNSDKVLVPVVDEPKSSDEFPGLYLDQLPSDCSLVLRSRPYIITHSSWKSRNTLLLISLDDGQVTNITPVENDKYLHHVLLTTNGKNQIVCAVSSPIKPNTLMLGTFQSTSGSVTWRCIDEPDLTPSMKERLSTISYSVIDIPNRYPAQTIVTKEKDDDVTRPCITYPHGGPHVVSFTSFNPQVVAFVLAGYTVSQPNYTGSPGYGNKYIDKLIGRCGELDVEDCMSSIRHLIHIGIAKSGHGWQFISGGSHGGFLAAHAIGQYPDFFTAAIMRNPVIAAGEMFSTTDIPDWCFAEFGVEYSAKTMLNSEIFDSLQKMSPIAHIDSIKTPVLLHLGDSDQRVPPYQGKNLYHLLKGRGKTVEMLMFPGKGHGLDLHVEPARLCWESSCDWFRRFSGSARQV